MKAPAAAAAMRRGDGVDGDGDGVDGDGVDGGGVDGGGVDGGGGDAVRDDEPAEACSGDRSDGRGAAAGDGEDAGTAATDARGAIVFSHANGFPAGTYRLLFDDWRAQGFEVHAVERYGHDPAYPVTSNWPRLRDQLLALVDACAAGRRVHLVGHSLGGYVSLLAASRRPAAVASVVLLDSPVVAGWRAQTIRVAKATGLVERMSPGRVSRRRRRQWPDRAAVLAHFAAKKAFAVWDPRVLADYVAAGTEPDPDGGSPDAVRLAFRREIETLLYDTLPHHIGPLLARHPIAAPVSFVGGTRSPEVRQVGMDATRRLTQGRLEWIDGGHLFPMERPHDAADAVRRAIAAAVAAPLSEAA